MCLSIALDALYEELIVKNSINLKKTMKMSSNFAEEDAEKIAKEEASKDGSADVKPEDLEEGEIAPTPKVKTLEELELDRETSYDLPDELELLFEPELDLETLYDLEDELPYLLS